MFHSSWTQESFSIHLHLVLRDQNHLWSLMMLLLSSSRQYLQLLADVFSPVNNTSLFSLLDVECFWFWKLKVLSSRGSIWLEKLLVNSFRMLFAFPFSISKVNNLDDSNNLLMLFGGLMWCKRDWIVLPSGKSSSIFPLLHKQVLLSSAFRRYFALDALLCF